MRTHPSPLAFLNPKVRTFETQKDLFSIGKLTTQHTSIPWSITDEMHDSFLREYKSKQQELVEQMQDHPDADEHFYITANLTLNIAKREKARVFLTFSIQFDSKFVR